jgi:AcrR family transcriptional regulator
MGDVVRWEANAQGRLERAALDLFAEKGYDQTTVAQIAQRAGLTERSFYRYFADKREVLFAGGEELREKLTTAIVAAPAEQPLFDVLVSAFAAVEGVFRPPDFLRLRAEVIAANVQLQERELVKLKSLSQGLAAAVERRGVDPRTAQVAADIGLLVMRLAAERWRADESGPYAEHVTAAAADLRHIMDEMTPGRPLDP